MAINIFSGSGGSSKKTPVNKASSSVRAQQAKQALQPVQSETSNSGNVAVGTKSTLSKVGNVVGKIAGVASKFLPGLGGTIAGAVSNLFNDPEWWQSVPGDALTLNEPLRFVEEKDPAVSKPIFSLRSAILEITVDPSIAYNTGQGIFSNNGDFTVITPTEQMITQYLMPQIRKVVNAIPLQDASAYNVALKSGATLYAMWRQLRKFDYMCKHGQVYMASMNDVAFPLFRTGNAAWLQSTINRLEEYLRANVRLPHTMCEYLSWRFGRVYKSNASVKSALVLYDVMPISAGPYQWDTAIARQMNNIASNVDVQKANTDIYNAYFDHDYMVDVRDDTQFRYDAKEFMLRLNLTGGEYGVVESSTLFTPSPLETLVTLDSSLDNPTAFMASTVSTTGKAQSGDFEVLFPVWRTVLVYIPSPQQISGDAGYSAYYLADVKYPSSDANPPAVANQQFIAFAKGYNTTTGSSTASSALWRVGGVSIDGGDTYTELSKALANMILLKSVDMYNCHIKVPLYTSSTVTTYSSAVALVDGSALSIDAGSPTFTTINTEHIYAFANLVDIDRKHSMSYKQAEKLVAKDTANLIDTLDVSSAATPGKA